MIHHIPFLPADKQHLRQQDVVEGNRIDYSDVIVKKPWGYEYLVFENEDVAIWMLHIVRKRGTSMHSHPSKHTGLILLSGHGQLSSLGGTIDVAGMDAVNIEAGAFHATEACSSLPLLPVSEDGIWVLEIESPPHKEDLCRLQDAYGRAGQSYEGDKDMVRHPLERLQFDISDIGHGVVEYGYLDVSFKLCTVGKLRGMAVDQALVAVVGGSTGIADPRLQPAVVRAAGDVIEAAGDGRYDEVLVLVIEREEQRMKLSDYMASYLTSVGCTSVFSVSGGGAMHLVDSFSKQPGMRYVPTHHEQTAAMAAEGYSRITNKMGITLVTTGPGGTNTITGLCGAWVDSIPSLYISGQVTQDTLSEGTGLRQFGVQEINIVKIVESITKYAVTVRDPGTIRYHLEKACYLATHGRPGPVWLDIPLNVQSKIVNIESQRGFCPEQEDLPDRSGNPLTDDVGTALTMLRAAERPVLIYGYGVRLAGAVEALNRVVTQLAIPTISSWTASDAMPTDDPNYVGRSGIMGDRGGNFAVQNSDLVMIIGSRMSIPQVGYNYKLFARAAKKIMIDVDPIEIHKPSLSIDLPVVADAGDFLEELSLQAEKDGPLAIDGWRQRCGDWKAKYPIYLDRYSETPDKINSFYFVNELSKRLGDDAIVVTDMGTSFTCTMQTLQIKMGQRLTTSSGFASMGFGLPGAIGACYGADCEKTILIVGDGSLQMTIQELQTVVHHQLPMIIFVINNNGYLTIKLMQQNHFGNLAGCHPGSGVSCPDTQKLAHAYGIDSVRLHNQRELDENLDQILAKDGPFICEIMMPEDQPLIPRVSSLKLPDGSIISKPMEDLFPFLDRDEFMENMIVEPVEVLHKKKAE